MESVNSPLFSFSTHLFRPSRLPSIPRLPPSVRFGYPIPSLLLSTPVKWAQPDPPSHLRHSLSHIAESLAHDPWLTPLKTVTFRSLLTALTKTRPLDILKWATAFSASVAAIKWVMNPHLLTYFEMVLVHWPWILAVSLAVYGTYSAYRCTQGVATTVEQIAVVSAVIVWLTVVPPTCLTGFLEGWPVVFCLAYHLVFFMNYQLRMKRRDEAEYPPPPARLRPEWDTTLPGSYRALFCVGVVASHWLAAFESHGSHPVLGGWRSTGIWALLATAVFIHYNSTYYLVSYSEDLKNPTGVVQFGAYRWVRHPLYLSNTLILAAYLAALRAPVSALFVTAVCLTYYREKAEVEERLMMRSFGEVYGPYRDRVRRKFVPFVY